jgi:hypothetical protein
MNKITVVCHKDHSHGYEDFEGKCLLCVVDDLMLEIGNLMVQKRRAEKREWTEQPDLATVGEVGIWGDKRKWVGLDQVEIMGMTCECVDDGTFNMDCAYDFARAIEARLKEKNT